MNLGTNRDHLKRLLTLGSHLNHTENLDDFLQALVNEAAELTQSESSTVLLFENETQQLYLAATHTPDNKDYPHLRVQIEQSVAGWVYSQSEAVTIQDMANASLITQSIEQSMGFDIRNLLAVPIIFGEQTIGVFEVVNKNQSYTSEDQEYLEILASYASTALQIERLIAEGQTVSKERDELEKQKSDFIAIASHELRTPLGLILGHTTFLREIIDNELYQNQLDVVIQSAEKLKEIIERLNRVENFQTGKASIRWKNTNLNALVNEVVTNFQPEARERQIHLQLEMPEQLIHIRCDATKLEEALANIIKNALIFSDKGQTVRVCLQILLEHVHITVEDSGIGIPAGDLHRIFERFYQVEPHLTRSHGGMGLGLSVAKAAVESHGGQIWVESTVGKGSIFTILLPTENTIS